MTGDEIRNVRFPNGPDYLKTEVSDLLNRIAAELDAERPAAPLIENAAFSRPRSWIEGGAGGPADWLRGRSNGYSAGAVDWFLEQLRRQVVTGEELARINADPWRDLVAENYSIRNVTGRQAQNADPPACQEVVVPTQEECDQAWRDFGQQPGTRLLYLRTGFRRRELRTEDQQAVASIRSRWRTTHSASGKSFTQKSARWAWSPGGPEPISRDQPGAPAHALPGDRKNAELPLCKYLDETGTPVLYTGGSVTDRRADGFIKFPGHRWLRFPVRGIERNAIMTAVDQAGNKVVRYRFADSKPGDWRTDIIVHPSQELTDELALAILLSTPWLHTFFVSEGQ